MTVSYTDNLGLAMLDDNGGNWQGVNNGNFVVIDRNVAEARDPLCFDDEMLIYDDEVLLWN